MSVKRPIITLFLHAILAFGLADIARAENIADLYAAQVPVIGQGSEARSMAIRTAFESVLVKISGDQGLPSQSAMSKAMQRANRYVQQYRYLSLGSGSGVDGAESAPDRLLWVRFDERAVNRLLHENGVPVWGSARPSTLIWLGIERKGSRNLYQQELDPKLGATLKAVARDRGLPILFPLMDLEDRSNLQVSDIWGDFEAKIRKASDRYQSDVILVGRLRRMGGNDWSADWTLYQSDSKSSWQNKAQSKNVVAGRGLQRAVDDLASRFAPQHASQGTSNLRVRISGLNHLADYVLVKDYLGSLVMVEQLDLLVANPASVSFIARVQGGREALEKGIMLGGVLEPVNAPDTVASADATSPEGLDAESLDYRLR